MKIRIIKDITGDFGYSYFIQFLRRKYIFWTEWDYVYEKKTSDSDNYKRLSFKTLDEAEEWIDAYLKSRDVEYREVKLINVNEYY